MTLLACAEQQFADLAQILMMPDVNQGTHNGPDTERGAFHKLFHLFPQSVPGFRYYQFCYVLSSQHNSWHKVNHFKIGRLRYQIWGDTGFGASVIILCAMS